MNRNVVSGIAAFALLVGAALAMNETPAYAGNCGGGLFAKLHAQKACGGGLLAKLRAGSSRLGLLCTGTSLLCTRAVCSEPAPVCCPEPAAGLLRESSRPKLFGRLIAKLKFPQELLCSRADLLRARALLCS